MKKCPYCGAQVNDDSHFCTECGKPIPQGNVCPHCGASVNEGDAFCQSCGKRVDENPSTDVSDTTQKKCRYCGASINDSDVFCENCGRNLADGSIGFIPNEVILQTYKAEENSSKKIIPIILGVLAVAIIGGGLWYWSSSSKKGIIPTNVRQEIVEDSIEEVIDSMVVEMTPEEIIKKRVNFIYNEAPDSHDFNSLYLSKELYDLFLKDEEITNNGDIGFIDYDIWSQSQGGNGNPLFIVKSAEIISENKATAQINIKYSESSESKDVKLVLIREGNDWVIDDFITGHETSLKQGLMDYIKSMEEEKNEQYEEMIDTVASY